MLKIKRRDFIKASATIVGAASLSGPVLNSLKAVAAPPPDGGGESPSLQWKPSLCVGCTTWCAAEVGVQEELGVKRAVQMRGNQNSKRHDGYLCPRGQLVIQEVYDPDRVKTPMKRKAGSPKGPGSEFIPITWDEAATEIAQKMIDLRNAGESHKVVLLRGRYTGQSGVLFDGISKIYGTPNYISHSAICAEAEKFSWEAVNGSWEYPDHDIDNTDYLLLWGVDPVSSNRMVPSAIRKLGDILETKKVTVVDPRLSASAAKAHRWLPVKPGTDGALALAIAHWILVQGLWNKSFVGLDDTVFTAGADATVGAQPEKGTKGLVTWWNKELKNRTPAWAAVETGIAEATIKAVAEEFANAKPKAISWLGPGAAMQPRAIYGAMAIAALNGLVGSYDHVGGALPLLSSIPNTSSTPSQTSYQDAIATTGYGKQRIDKYVTSGLELGMPQMNSGAALGGTKVTNRVADAINDSSPYDVKMVITNMNNFTHSCQGAQRWEQALSKAGVYVAVSGTHASESAMFADIVLPGAHYLFEVDSFEGSKARRWRDSALHQKVINRLWDSKDIEVEFAWLLAKKMYDLGWNTGGDVAGADNLYAYYRNAFHVTGFTSQPTTEAEFADVAVRYFTTKGAAAERTAQWSALTGGAFTENTTQAPDSTVVHDIGNGIRQATYASTYFNANGEGQAWQYAVTGSGTKNFGTASKKIEFCNNDADGSATEGKMKKNLRTHATNKGSTIPGVLTACNYPQTVTEMATKGNEYAWMPHWEAPVPQGDAGTYPFVFIDYKSRLNREGRSQNSPWYYEFKATDAGDERWDDVIKMNPADVAALGLTDGSKVKVTSPWNTAGVIVTLKSWQGVGQGTVAKAYGQGHWATGRFASTMFGRTARGGSNNHLVPAEFERLTGSTARNGVVRVKIERA